MSDMVRTESRGPVLEITLDRPKANAIDTATSRRLAEVFNDFENDSDARVAILTAAGDRFFSAGWDLKAAALGNGLEGGFGSGGFAGIRTLTAIKKPVIAAINGITVGGGFELALSADLMIVAEHAEFFLPETSVGVVPDVASIILPRRLPRAVALELLLTRRKLDAAEAVRLGLANTVVPVASLLSEARSLAERIIAGAPLSVAAIIELEREAETMSVREALEGVYGRQFQAVNRTSDSEDAKEGPRAFAEKRAPVWKGR